MQKKKSTRHRFIEVFVIVTLLLVLLAKFFFRNHGLFTFLILYGLAITLVMWMSFMVAFLLYKDPYEVAIKNEKRESKANSKIIVSCMVSVKDEEENINRCIDSMLRQAYPHKEIIVVNDASTDGTLAILKKYESEKKIILIDNEVNIGKKKSLGLAMAKAKGELFAHTDSDSVWASDVIEKAVKIFEHNPHIGALSGHGRALNGDKNFLTKAQDSWMEGQFSIRKSFESYFGAVTCVSGPLAVFRKEAVYNYIPAWVHDTFLGQEFKFATDRTLTGLVLGSATVGRKIQKKYADSPFIKDTFYANREWAVVYCKSMKSFTIVPDTFKKFIKQQIRWKKSFIRNIFFTGVFYWKKPVPTAVVYYLHVMFVLMGPFVSFRHLIYLPLRGNILSAFLYLSGIVFVGFMFGIAQKLEEKESKRWVYRPVMSLLSTLVISWLIFYSALTIKKMVWSRA